MAGEPTTTITGNLTADPDLRFTLSGTAYANFTIASTPRVQDRQTNAWKDGETLFIRCTVWREAAQYVIDSLHKGDRVIAEGTLRSRSFENKEGEKRTVIELDAEEVGASMRYGAVKPASRSTTTKETASANNGSPADDAAWSTPAR